MNRTLDTLTGRERWAMTGQERTDLLAALHEALRSFEERGEDDGGRAAAWRQLLADLNNGGAA